ncbi:MAG: sigma-70 family RNA polymerase sigma factor [Nitrospira sp.]|nr:sigma-70 family RNA polymerase sigma factor [Nitrospira sp.]MDH4250544.1 sigma-70 family RNA polymerase sigma factor [Nitrospira sp.]MDH4341864.1 sigma-70 family RNA polymerase sigma factor [Nitrospira sp.]MDH5336703.1 sigma-70 family RNA polymerase sigma factor [Nitrospira sp.]
MSANVTRDTGSIPLPVLAGNASRLMNDEDRLVSQLRAREEETFEAVVTHYQETLIRMAMRYVANRATAEEVVQETWIAVMIGLNRFEGRSSLHAWICAILIHKAKDRGVREKRQKVFSDFKLEADNWSGEINLSWFRPCKEWPGPAEFSQHLWDDRTPEKLLASREATACMWHAIETLPPPQKEVLILRDVQGIHTKEVCRQLKISETNFYVRLHRARERVKVAVEAALG